MKEDMLIIIYFKHVRHSRESIISVITYKSTEHLFEYSNATFRRIFVMKTFI